MKPAVERVKQMQALMKEKKIDAYLIPTADFHESEYTGPHFGCRKYVTGFTGSAGTAVILSDWAGVWTDGRYFVQAAAELEDSGVELMKAGQLGVPTIEAFLQERLPEGGVLGFDGRVMNAQMAEGLQKKIAKRGCCVYATEDLVGQIWMDRPALPKKPVWILEEKYAGKPAAEKLKELREQLAQADATAHVITTLDDIVWLLNIRGNDTPCNPSVLSFLVLTQVETLFFVNPEVISEEVEAYLATLDVVVKPYEEVYGVVANMKNETVWIEKGKANFKLVSSLDESNGIIDKMNPSSLKKAQKNPTEIANIKLAHIKDGVAMAKFHHWLKGSIGTFPMTETMVGTFANTLRKEQGALEPSFSTISAYGANAAMCHYHAEDDTCAVLRPRGLYLIDSGGQYLEGTTDITRTYALGPVTQEEKEHYTLVLMSMLRLAHAKFLQGCTGLTLDYIAREELWKRGLDYNHGTGHGVGYLLNVHERPAGIRYKVVPERQDSEPILPGMVMSDEPGLYIEGSHGIRTENMIVCAKGEKNQYGQFLHFEMLTCAPIDLEPLEISLMTDQDIEYLNDYHAFVYENLAPLLDKEEADWLKEVTAPVAR